MHALASAAKANYTTRLLDGIDVIRRACGGHGFLDIARFNTIYNLTSPLPVFEGDNTVLYLQTASYLVKAL